MVIAQDPIIDTFGISGQAILSPVALDMSSSSSSSSKSPLGLVDPLGDPLGNPLPFGPQRFHSCGGACVQLSIGVSPITLHLQEQLLHELGSWCRIVGGFAFGLSEHPSLSRKASSLSRQGSASLPSSTLDGNIFADLLLHEVCVCVDAEHLGPVDSTEKFATELAPPKSEPIAALFELSARMLLISAVAHRVTAHASAPVDPQGELRVSLQSLDLTRAIASPEAIKRIVCTVEDETESDGSSSNCLCFCASIDPGGALSVNVTHTCNHTPACLPACNHTPACLSVCLPVCLPACLPLSRFDPACAPLRLMWDTYSCLSCVRASSL